MTDNLAEYEAELDSTVTCTHDGCTIGATHRLVHKCGWGVLVCQKHSILFVANTNHLRASALQRAMSGPAFRCPHCLQPITYNGDFTIDTVL